VRGRATAAALVALAALVGLPAAAEDGAVGMTEEEHALASSLLASTVAVAVTRADERPGDTSGTATGLVIDEAGLVATSWRTLAAAPPGARTWIRGPQGPWTLAAPVGATWWADVAVLRAATTRRLGPAVAFASAQRQDLGRRFLVVGAPVGRNPVALATVLAGLAWFDGTSATGWEEVSRPSDPMPRAGASPSALRVPAASWLPTAAGAPVFDAQGRCVGMVVGPDPSLPEERRVVVRAGPLVELATRSIAKANAFDPADLGVTFGPEPTADGRLATLPEDLRRVRERARGGAVVRSVLAHGPANGRLWEGDVVLAVNGRALFAEIPASYALAFLTVPAGTDVEVTVFRGGRPQTLRVGTAAARSLHRDFGAVHEDAGAALRR
jgi:S1-C subfamily serine protease